MRPWAKVLLVIGIVVLTVLLLALGYVVMGFVALDQALEEGQPLMY